MKMWMVGCAALFVGLAGGMVVAEQRGNPQPWQLFEPGPVRPGQGELPVGRYQAVTDGNGGLLIIDTRNTYIIKHVIKERSGWSVKYDAIEAIRQ
jgi:hypothetical protein